MTNVDPTEIAKFEALAARWWDPAGEFRALHDMNPIRHEYIAKHKSLGGIRALDVGCGGGILSESLARAGARVTGIDMTDAPLAVARLHATSSGLVNLEYQRTTAEQLAESAAGQFDLVCCMEMLEHVPDPSSVVQACATLAKPGATLMFSTINRNPRSFLFAILGAEYVLQLLPRGTHQYRKFIRPSELAQWCRKAGLSVEDTTGILYNPLNRQFSLSRSDVAVNYMVRAHKAA